MEVKILCPCGSKYKFDVEPVNGQLPGPVQCPVCSQDGTAAGNAIIASAHSQAAPAAAPAAAPRALRVGSAPAPSVAAAPTGVVPQSAAPAIPRSSAEARTVPSAPPPTHYPPASRSSSGPSMALAVIGAAVGGTIGMLVWYGITVGTMKEYGIVAWGLGAFTGWCARFLGKGVSPQIGIAAGAVALVAILGGQVMADYHIRNRMVDGISAIYVETRVAYAKEAVEATSDDKIRQLIAERDAEEDEPTAEEIQKVSAAQIQEFKTTELPKLRRIASGQMPKAELERESREELSAEFGNVLTASFSFWTVLWLVFGVGSAFKIGSGQNG